MTDARPRPPGLPFDKPADAPRFDGPEYKPARDHERLGGQLLRIFALMKDGEWRTIEEVARRTVCSENSASAQLRHLRKKRFGSHTVNRRHVVAGLFEYQLIPNPQYRIPD